jgi:hypothetical protein
MGRVGITEILLFLIILIRIVVTIYRVNRAGKLNQNKFVWGFFGFFFPLIAFIVIQFMKPHESI